MKIQKFLIWIQKRLLNYPDISLTTTKMIIDNFTNCLSLKEFYKNEHLLKVITELALKQITIDSVVNNIKTNNLETELNKLKSEND